MRTLSGLVLLACAAQAQPVRAVYGGVPDRPLKDLGVNAVFLGEHAVTAGLLALVKQQGARFFAEFNTMHVASYVKQHPDAAPIGADGKPCPAPNGWQGVCPTHPDYRRFRMKAFEALLKTHAVDGVWLDYHHAHASWERAKPELPDTCFCDRCLLKFQRQTGVPLPDLAPKELASRLLGRHKQAWVRWRCEVFSDWVREFKEIRDRVRPRALLGSFHCPWTDKDFDRALKNKLAIDLKAQARYLDVMSPMVYHACFGHATDPAWIARQTAWLAGHLRLEGYRGERPVIWPIVQLADWGEVVPLKQVPLVLDQAARAPSTGVIVFRWSAMKRRNPMKIDAMAAVFTKKNVK